MDARSPQHAMRRAAWVLVFRMVLCGNPHEFLFSAEAYVENRMDACSPNIHSECSRGVAPEGETSAPAYL